MVALSCKAIFPVSEAWHGPWPSCARTRANVRARMGAGSWLRRPIPVSRGIRPWARPISRQIFPKRTGRFRPRAAGCFAPDQIMHGVPDHIPQRTLSITAVTLCDWQKVSRRNGDQRRSRVWMRDKLTVASALKQYERRAIS